MFIYALATAYTLHYVYLLSKNIAKTLFLIRRHHHLLITALEFTNISSHLSSSMKEESITASPEFISDNEYVGVGDDEYSSSGSAISLEEFTEDVVQEIMEDEDVFISSEKQNNTMYLGHYFVSPDVQDAEYPLMMLVAIQPETFMKYSSYYVEKYMEHYCESPRQLELMKTDIRQIGQFKIYNVILKTYWLRLIQRHWKKVYSQRKYMIHNRMKPTKMFQYLMSGKYSPENEKLPSLKGMLTQYV